MEVIQNEKEHQFQLQVDGHTAYIAYKRAGDIIILTSTQVPKSLSGQGIGSKLVSQTIDRIEASGLKIVPVCTFVQAWFKKHPEKQHVLA